MEESKQFIGLIEWPYDPDQIGPDDRFTIFSGSHDQDVRETLGEHILSCADSRDTWQEWFGVKDNPKWDMTDPAAVDELLTTLEENEGLAPQVHIWEATRGDWASYLPR
ncbi:hypothetical protein [Nonomuraea zeae]|uniref:hypothetical protein n=1 Tax=Nonomuraea zeae TaxID=1642303 RepID=UPI00362136A5